MAGLLANFRNTVIVSLILALIMVVAYSQGPQGTDMAFWQAVFRWLHVFVGILWIGLLYYFNFVQIRKMPEVPAELKPAVSKYIAPEALFWFRWSALLTVVMGIAIAFTRGAGYGKEVFTLGLADGYTAADKGFTLMGVGTYLGIIMFINVWAFIWPNQKIALGIVDADADAKAKAARAAMLFSRTNMLLSIPMLTSMTMTQTIFG
jgi:uncharacterized membrane protein